MTPNVFRYDDFREFVQDFVRSTSSPRGQYRKIALALNISTTMVSQVFKGSKVLSLEAASDLCDYLGLGELESEYFLTLVEIDRTSHFKLRRKFQHRNSKLKKQAEKLETRLAKDHVLDESAKATFYSSWVYSAVRNLSAIESLSNVDALASHLQLPRSSVQAVIKFLVQSGLLIEKEKRLEVGPKRTHLGAESPLISMHHRNWRLKGMEKMDSFSDDRLFYTAPMSLSEDVAKKIRSELPNFIEKLNRWVHASSSQTSRCLNIDWFEIA